MAKINSFGAFMRSYGLKIFFFPYVAFFMYMYTTYLVEDISYYPEPPTYTWPKTIFIWIFRINGMVIFLPSFTFLATYFIAKFPQVREGPDTDVSPGTITEFKIDTKNGTLKNGYKNGHTINGKNGKNGVHQNGVKNGLTHHTDDEPGTNGWTKTTNGFHKNGVNGVNGVKNGLTSGTISDRMSCFIIRIITRGDYPELIKRNVAFHINLVEKYCHLDRLEAHIVTEKPLHGDYKVGNTGFAREIVVPRDYKPQKGTIAKARNLVYWALATSKDSGYPPDDKTWVLTLDEDSFITDSFVIEFLHRFLPSGAHCSVNPSLIQLPSPYSFFNGCEESFFVTLQAMGMWLEASVLRRTPLWFRSAAYVVRRDVDKEIGSEYQPEICISDDHVFGHYFSDSRYKIGYINGWNWEFGAPDVLGLIKQRARWFRGIIYPMFYQDMSKERRFCAILRLVMMYVIQGSLMLNSMVATWFLFCGHVHVFLPAAPRGPVDYFTSFAFATFFYANVFGAWHTMSTRAAIFYTIASTFWIGIQATFHVHSASLIWSLVTLADDLIKGKLRFEVTEKKET